MAVKTKSKAKTTEFEKLVASYAERVSNGELTPLKAVQYREFGDDKGYFIVVDEEQDLTGTIWVNDSTVPDKFRTSAGKEITLVTEEGEEVMELQARGMKHKLYFFATAVEEEGGYLSLDNEDLEDIMPPADATEPFVSKLVRGG